MKAIISAIDDQFSKIDQRSRDLLKLVTEGQLYVRPHESVATLTPFSCGEYVLRSAAMVEQAFLGITRRLWDDPFEWTLPEKLSTIESVLNYLDEVDAERRQGIAFLRSDEDLRREIPAPDRMLSIMSILLNALAKADHFQGRAYAIYQVIGDQKLPRI